ncbi:permease for cytosine/purines, uracil, thiamine, allantoin-domain-containing protein [Lipomyces tetrasporus]|uniref:Permease for cytosine/purines, uracil, thiamine, allantoin-domain-containing protein n=1 Tax=Lipomyces tetrasporus TaxID=54092 RepID=A0AAD7QY57_9ASCO|nr:permease for cytosine/purines, uracil, thiamine, allantoin-domain-containing protein [Lipomyces tetrasporus]KAJ8103588.1 permease for cytosine/purines, uracil, thiamine, allantoin-domain-containing protein [Lipomyces tetrasporus]
MSSEKTSSPAESAAMDITRPSAWSRITKRLELSSVDDQRRSNADLDPVPPHRRTWRTHNFVMYWISDNFSPSGFRNAASLMAIGLSWRDSLVCITVAQFIIGVVIVLNGVVGSRYHINFSIQSRASFGFYFSYLMIIMRMIVGIFWYGIQAYTGAECVRSMIYAIWPSFHNVENTLPASANIDTQMMTAYVVYFVIVLPMHYIPMHHLKWLFTIKSITTPIVGFAIMGWVINQVGVSNTSLWTQETTLHGSTLAWTFLSGLYANIGTWSTLAVNVPDFTRYAANDRSAYITALVLPATGCLITFFGVVSAAGSNILYGQILWDPLLLIDNWTSSGGRAAAFFCAFFFLIAQIGVNIAANSISAANDLNCLFPRYINIRRGQIIVAFIGSWALTPWNILTGAPAFISFMSGYSVWLGPMAGVLLSDFYLVHKQKYDVWELYNKHGIYRYNKWGTNWRAFIAFFVGWVPLLPGFIPTVNSSITVSTGATHLYYLGYFYGVGAAALSYYVLCRFWPATETMLERAVLPDADVIHGHSGEDMEEGIEVALGDEYVKQSKD